MFSNVGLTMNKELKKWVSENTMFIKTPLLFKRIIN